MKSVRAFAPGRTELAGNHTDHQGGRVIAAAVSCGIDMELQDNGSNAASLESAGFAPVEFSLCDLAPVRAECNTTAALVRGVVACLREAGVPVTGFEARVSSTVPAGSGLSSSAAFELALASGLLVLFGDGADFASIDLARMGQRAESEYFGKPCGLMDQAAVAYGGVNLFDFGTESVSIERIDIDFSCSGYALCLIDTHCDHSLYTEEYAQVARDMGDVAQLLGVTGLSQVTRDEFLSRFEDVRSQLGDLPALRGLHYYNEMRLVEERAQALREGDMAAFLVATRASGASSAQYLQNVSTFDRACQPAMVALALADLLLEGEGAVRIHGGGFGGTVQAFAPVDRLEFFRRGIDAQLGEGSCQVYDIVDGGARAQWAAE